MSNINLGPTHIYMDTHARIDIHTQAHVDTHNVPMHIHMHMEKTE